MFKNPIYSNQFNYGFAEKAPPLPWTTSVNKELPNMQRQLMAIPELLRARQRERFQV